MRFRLSLARELGKTLAEIDEMTIAELRLWGAYSEYEARQANLRRR